MTFALGLVPVVDDAATRGALTRVAAHLTAALDRPCSVQVARSPAALVEAFAAGAVDLSWTSPTLALRERALRRAIPVATCVRQGVAHYHGVVFVKRHSPIRSALQLRGRRMGWVAETSAAGYIFPRLALAGLGLDPTVLFRAEQFFATHGALVLSVLDGVVDAGATFAVFESGDPMRPMVRAGFVDLGFEDDVRVLLATPAIPSDLFLATPPLHEAHGEALLDALSGAAERHPDAFHRVFGAEGVVPPSARALADLRRQLDDARALGVLDGPLADAI
ncbi:MAG: PhnD/SsuA/transferrin family substrate-binding protein [Sandaracinaceae bacterium]|nr:PhnD/SsuA/transferrin family substrate-binding protein [Sandaracinaceae bacterium]